MNENFGIEGERVRLVPIDPERHTENCYRWLNDPSLTSHLGTSPFPLTRMNEISFMESAAAGSTSSVRFAIELRDGTHIGQSSIESIQWVHRHAETGSFIGSPDHRGKGYGTEAAILRSRYAFHCLGLLTLYSGYLEFNAASAKMQARIGYRIWGRQPRAEFKDGHFYDLVRTVLTKEDFEANYGLSERRITPLQGSE